LEHTISERDGVLIFGISGKPNRGLFEVFEANVDPKRKVALDLSQAGAFLGDDIEDLVRCHNFCEHSGGALVLSAPPKDLAYIIGILSLDEFFTLIETVDEAAEQLAKVSSTMEMTTLRMIAIQKDKLKDTTTEPEEAARQMVEQVKYSMRYLAPNRERVALLEFFERLGPAELSVAEAADEIGQDEASVEEAFARLAGLRVLVPNRRGLLRYAPGPTTRQGIQAILEMWRDEGNREKMLQWAMTTDALPDESGDETGTIVEVP
jgi:hypothetical protein